MEYKYYIAYTTTDSKSAAKNIARELIKQKIAACCSIINNIESIYFWENQICDDEEYLLMIKTTKSKIDRLKNAISELHNYDTPEILIVPVVAGSEKYLNWIDNTIERND
jgi:periplasmic divalent cation tolerance protein